MLLRRLDRYVLGEIIGPLALGFLIYTFIMLLRLLFRMADLIIRSEVPPDVVGRLFLLSLPNIVVLTIPMSFLFAVLLAVGRLSADSELVAIRASGISLFTLYRPIFVLSALLTGLNIYLMLEALPEGNHAWRQMQAEILSRSISEEIEPRIPTGFEDRTLFVFEVPPGERRWRGVFLAKSAPAGETEIHIAEWGEARRSDDGTMMFLTLHDSFFHQVNLNAPPAEYRNAFHSKVELPIQIQSPRQAASSVKRGLRELRFRDLKRTIEDPETPPILRNLAKVELQKKFSIPAACLVFGLLGLPLGFTSARGGRSSGFALSLFVILIYYILISLGEDFASRGLVPAWLSVWLANVVLLVVGLFLLARRNQDKSLVLSRVDRWIRDHLWRGWLTYRERQESKRADRLQVTGERRHRSRVVLRVPDFSFPFATAIDRYVLMTFLRVLTIAASAGVLLYIVADLTENAESILKHDVPWEVVFDYYKLKSIGILYQIAPVIVLVTTLIAFGILSRSNEVTACKALGVSLFRISMPVVFSAMFVSGVCLLLQREVLAASTERVNELHDKIRGRDSPTLAAAARGPRSAHRWLYSNKSGYLFNYASYDPERQEVSKLQVFRFDDSYRLTNRLVVEKASYVGEGWWKLSGGWARSFDYVERSSPDERPVEESLRVIESPVREQLAEEPDFFLGQLRAPQEMDFFELRQYIQDLRSFGRKDLAPLEVELHNKIAYPFLSLVMALVALPFAFRLGRQGALYGIGLSLVLGIVLFLAVATFSTLGQAAILPPIAAVWSPAVIFSVFSLYVFLGVRT